MINNRTIVLQDVYLNQARRERIPVRIKMLDGELVRGIVRGFDSFTVILDADTGTSEMIYKHAIASVVHHGTAVFEKRA